MLYLHKFYQVVFLISQHLASSFSHAPLFVEYVFCFLPNFTLIRYTFGKVNNSKPTIKTKEQRLRMYFKCLYCYSEQEFANGDENLSH